MPEFSEPSFHLGLNSLQSCLHPVNLALERVDLGRIRRSLHGLGGTVDLVQEIGSIFLETFVIEADGSRWHTIILVHGSAVVSDLSETYVTKANLWSERGWTRSRFVISVGLTVKVKLSNKRAECGMLEVLRKYILEGEGEPGKSKMLDPDTSNDSTDRCEAYL